ncbi:outer membrane protein transport protein [Gilvimarinus agarilyticus]|uniref:OmpP1/FadL family transporter n=1 Tax=Gilvimarinus sp. 2_MG-2023 TaxID=3062666 RepID=UPI001C09629A|nr:outer membrane protein transport protein [Gilvimarinus sp. 2_MG-2023]MBU2887808.1 outer membrane protein transport protein [Gilvimarinus agarilyticus]MDO6572447.1 outer membrane protein transport protein [Gilvimarinus sp. 2_MG-2023]
MYHKFNKTILATTLACLPVLAHSASFQLLEQSPAHMGKAFAGTGSDITDASTVYFNPAGMTQIDRTSFTAAINFVATDATFNDEGSSFSGGGDNTDELGVIPNLYAVVPLSDRFSVGFGINAPYGLSSSFSDEWVGRYSATYSELQLVNINATTAWQIADFIAVGVGINYQTIEADLQSQVDSTLGLAPSPATDSSAQIKGDDDGFVIDLSVLITPSDKTSIGVSWREGGEYTLEGEATFDFNAACSPGVGAPLPPQAGGSTGTACFAGLSALGGDIESDVTLPDTLTVSATQYITDGWAFHADIAKTSWSSIQNIQVINVGNGAEVDVLDLQYDDTMRYALGTSMDTGAWTWRAGVALDEAPQTNPEHVSPRIPDADRTWLSLGANWEVSANLSLDFGYTHLLIDDASLIEEETNDLGITHKLSGSFDSSVDIFAAQLNWQF